MDRWRRYRGDLVVTVTLVLLGFLGLADAVLRWLLGLFGIHI